MLNKFLSYIEQKKLISPGTKTILAVSGGKDSMVMLDLMQRSGLAIIVGHINHQLRGEDSEADAHFVKEYCMERRIPYYQYDIDPYLLSHGNLQDKARQIRYEKLHNWAATHNCAQIATAHHLDDRIETFLMYIMRGTGLHGMTSISAKNGAIIRPLLWTSANEITQYIHNHAIPYREDSSNASDKYLRNHVRHHVIPAMIKADSRTIHGIKQTIQHIESTIVVFDFLLDEYAKNIVSTQFGRKTIDLNTILHLNFATDILYYLVKDEGFNHYQCADMIRNQNGHFYSMTHEAIVHQRQVIIREIKEKQVASEPLIIHSLPYEVTYNNTTIKLSVTDRMPVDFTAKNTFYIDEDKIIWPLTIRPRQPGDVFRPFGMQGKSQKVKDYLINRKCSAFDKEDILIIEDTSQIMAVLPLTIAHNVQLNKATKKVVQIQINKK